MTFEFFKYVKYTKRYLGTIAYLFNRRYNFIKLNDQLLIAELF